MTEIGKQQHRDSLGRKSRNSLRGKRIAIICLIGLGAIVVSQTDLYAKTADQDTSTSNAVPPSVEDSKDRPVPGQLWIDPLTGMEFVWLKADCYKMGSPQSEKGRYLDEEPLHEVCLDGFWMGRYEVTNALFRQYKPEHDSKDNNDSSLNGDQQPVVYVNWHEATEYAAWLSAKSSKSFRLPTEAEWEYAARGGSITARHWGEDPNDACGYANVHDLDSKRLNKFKWTHHDCKDGYAVTAPVGSFKPNDFGLYDMLGNVWEWTQDLYGGNYYSKSPRENPQGPVSGSRRINRGGGWDDTPRDTRSAHRNQSAPESRYNYVGLRLVISAQEQ